MKTITKSDTKAQTPRTPEQAAVLLEVAKLNNIKVDSVRNGISGEAILSAICDLNNFLLGASRGGHGVWVKGALKVMKLVGSGDVFTSFDAFEATCDSVTAAHVALIHADADARFAKSVAENKPVRTFDAAKALTVADFQQASRACATLRAARMGEFTILYNGANETTFSAPCSLKLLINDTFYTAQSAAKRNKAVKAGRVYSKR
ncbi:MAG: hypothetical protein WCI73_06285 [Phycisphaerae bacterium]